MCRRNQLYGWMLLAFGLGLLVGLCLESCFPLVALAVVLSILGFRLLRR